METNNELSSSSKRPTGMTILLVLSFINACLQIFGSGIMFVGTPVLEDMLSSGQVEDLMRPFFASMDESMFEAYMAELELRASIKPIYYLFNLILYIGSLAGVIKMFKMHRVGFHTYSISQILILINSVVFIYSHQTHSSFFSEFLTTLLFILIYHLYFKRIEMAASHPGNNDFHPDNLE